MPDAWVYLLRCRVGSLYIGWTVDLERRLARHRSSVASRYTASRLPVELTDLQEALHYAAEAVRERELPLAG